MTFELVVTCADGLEDILKEELTGLGVADIRRSHGALMLRANLEQAYSICLWSRVASRVLLPLFTVKGSTPDELYAEARNYAWADVLDPAGTIAVHATAARGIKIHTQYLALKLKDAVADHCREQHGRRPDVDTAKPDVPLQVHAHAEGFDVSVDLSGESMHRRAYRVAMTEAPIKETLAAALLLQAGWSSSSSFEALLDPMCGSGTFLVEAASIAADVAPGLQRDYFGFFGWRLHQPELWLALRDQARLRREAGLQSLTQKIFGFDADAEAVEAAQRNIKTAGFAGFISVEQRELADLQRPEGLSTKTRGLLITNPPYGERLGEKPVIRELYRALGRLSSQQLAGWQSCVLASDIQHADALGFQHRSTLRLHNGAIIVYARQDDIPAATVREANFQEVEGEIPEEGQAFANRLRKNLKAAQKQAAVEGVYCYRVYDADMPEFNLAVDVYEGQLHVQEYAPPKTVEPEKAEARFKLALTATRHVFGLRRENVFIKVRSRQKGSQQYEKKGSQGRFQEVREGRAVLQVNLTDYLDTGLFLDHRPLRLQMAREAQGKHFLNLFAYTGVASVQAALGGAASTTTVDLSPTYIEWAQRNFALNGLAPDRHHFDQADCMKWLRDCDYEFDLIFMDPPTFSNSKRTPDVFDVQRDHVEMIWLAMRALTPGGTLYFSNNFRKFKLDVEALQEFLIEDISSQTIGFDFQRNPNIHRCWKVRHPAKS